MGTLATLTIKLIGDTAGFVQDMDKAEKTASGFSDKMVKVGAGMTAVGAGLTAGVTAPIVGAFSDSIDAASDLSETVSKVQTVFGKEADSMIAWGEAAAKSIGLSKQEALSAAGTYGNLFRGMNMTEQASADMSKNIVQLAADLGSFNNMETPEVLEKLRAGLTGETEPLKSLGVNLNAAMVEQKAFQMGLVKTNADATVVNGAYIKLNQAIQDQQKAYEKYGEFSLEGAAAAQKVAEAQKAVDKALGGTKVELDAAAKAQATMALVMEQTKLAQGDFARTSDGLANSQRTIKAEIANVTAAAGAQLLPIVLQVVTYFKGWLDWLSRLTPEQQKMAVIILAVVAAIGPLLTMLGGLVTAVGALAPVFTGIVGVLSGPVLLVIGLVIAVIAALYYAWTNNIGGIQEKTAAVLAWLQTAFANIAAFIGRHGTEISGILKGAYDTVANIVALAFTIVTGILKAGYQLLTGDTKGAMETIKGTISLAWTLIQGTFNSAKTTILNTLALLWDTTVSGARERLGQVKQTVVSKFEESMDYLRGLPKLMWDLAANMIQGLIDGIKARGDQVGSVLLDIIKRAVKNFTDFLGIKSPSRVFIDRGMNMMRGLAIGIDRFGQLPGLSLQAVGTTLATGPVDAGSDDGRGDKHVHFHDVHVRKDEDIDAITRKVLAKIGARQ